MSPRATHVGTSVLVQAWSGLAGGVLFLGLAAAAVHEYTGSAADDSLAGLALVVAAALAVPGVLGVVLGGVGPGHHPGARRWHGRSQASPSSSP